MRIKSGHTALLERQITSKYSTIKSELRGGGRGEK
jgi:hypothetical protein